MDGNTTYAQTTCEIGGDLILPSPPTKRGYTFKGWLVEYARLEYIESTGTQYIDTGFDANVPSNKLLTTTLDFQATTTTNDRWVFGGHPGNNNGNYLIGSYGGQCVGVYNKFYRKSSFDTNRHTVIVNSPDGSFWDGVKIGEPVYNTSGLPNKLYLMASHHLQSGAWNLPCKMFYCKIELDGIVLREFIPAKRLGDNAVGMYDTVSRTFFTNNGTGEFIAGPVAENQNFNE